jgi:uncharacterized coiled-coil protein SlyX
MENKISERMTLTGVAVKTVFLLLLIGAVAYGLHQRNVVKSLKAEGQANTTALDQTRAQMTALAQRLDAMQAKPAVEPAPKPSPVRRLAAGPRHAAVHRRADDPRWKKVQDQIAANQKAIDDTRNDLSNSKTELQGSIAKTHDELVVLERKGERNYFEFDVSKSKQFNHAGPVALRLKKANTKHQFADLEMLVDDVQLSKKHINLYEPVMLSDDNGQPTQLVINKIANNQIHGYISMPKYRSSELATVSAANTSAPDGQKPSPIKERQRLQPPQ